METKAKHIPVLLKEVVEAISPIDNGVYVDGTFGAGGYTSAILDTANCTVIAIDRDPNAIKDGQDLVKKYNGRLKLVEGTFGDMVNLVHNLGYEKVDGVMLDIGVSSMQIDQAERGFSFQKDGALDMRMSQSGLSAADVLNTFSEQEIADIIYLYGEERFSRKIAAAVVHDRKEKPFKTTMDFANLLHRIIPHSRDQIDPATRSFQALRIYVNDELGQLKAGLIGAEQLLKAGGRMAVVSFHSLEDRIVKKFITEKTGMNSNPSRYMPVQKTITATLKSVSKKPIMPNQDEININPRSRSSRLRVAERI